MQSFLYPNKISVQLLSKPPILSPKLWRGRRGRGAGAVALATQLGRELRASCEDLWARSSLEHPFLEAVRDGAIEEEQFNTWLLQVVPQLSCPGLRLQLSA